MKLWEAARARDRLKRYFDSLEVKWDQSRGEHYLLADGEMRYPYVWEIVLDLAVEGRLT